MDEPRYTLAEAKRELERRQCFKEGHAFSHVTVARTGDPIAIFCERCGRHWPVSERDPEQA